ncbi:OLC1v1016826C1 [Oldenlandia corymbosa var. corymbosa]|uniref:OLC1v1016826C1 n=1 Tax=Oldenlandia corymbosa var. corymbosa TaxID=529605 RepID=A0AAV1E826_OLDCO|nr:OLC1v1016826C1 [Oldenlandia corymbosa var. corymbosa]
MMNPSNRMDTDMMEADFSSAPPPPPSSQPPPSIPDQVDGVRGLLSTARQLIDQGRPSQALQVVVMAMRSKGGEEAVFQTLTRARELYRNKVECAAADELATLFAECAIVEAIPSSVESSSHCTTERAVELSAHGSSILAETGRDQIVLDAFADGSSFVCLQCGGLVSNQRKDEHYAFWCCKL